jgi:large subunit ribosomal protein L25
MARSYDDDASAAIEMWWERRRRAPCRYHQSPPMASQSTKLPISAREVSNSRATRRLRRAGQVPGVLYGGDAEPLAFTVDERELRHALAARGAVVELQLGKDATPAVLKDAQRHPVRGTTLHVDFLRVRLDVAIHAVVALELVGGDDAPGAKEGGVLEHITREVNIEALPTDIPERLELDVSQMQVNDTVTLAAVSPPHGVTILDDLEETVVATLTPPRLEAELEALDEEALEQETAVVGEGEAPAEAEEGAEEAPAEGGDAADEGSE